MCSGRRSDPPDLVLVSHHGHLQASLMQWCNDWQMSVTCTAVNSNSLSILMLWLSVASTLQLGPAQLNRFTELRSDCQTGQSWSNIHQVSVTALPTSLLNCYQKHTFVFCVAVISERFVIRRPSLCSDYQTGMPLFPCIPSKIPGYSLSLFSHLMCHTKKASHWLGRTLILLCWDIWPCFWSLSALLEAASCHCKANVTLN